MRERVSWNELGRTTSDEFIEERKEGVNCVEVSRCCGEVR